MKVSKKWLTELVDLNLSMEKLIELIPLRIQGGIDSVTEEYIELDLKGYNRADLLSMRGVAYEIMAITGSEIKFRDPPTSEYSFKGVDQKLEVEVADSEIAPLYCLAKIEGLKIDKSNPDWIQKLEDSGMRSVNNITDITNLMMLEYGQPLHSFDASTVKDEKIVVRLAKNGEKIETLDGKSRELKNTDLVIADSEKALGIAGVMGGKNSEIPDSGEVTILLEAAIFEPITIRKTASRLGLSSEASKRFQHGLTKRRLFQAFSEAIRAYEDLGGKLVSVKITGDYPEPEVNIKLNLSKVRSLIGVDISNEEIDNYLSDLLFSFEYTNDESWIVSPPYWRLDINIEEDVIEEVARMYGYENITAKPLEGTLPQKVDQSQFDLVFNLKSTLKDLGLSELQTYSYASSNVLNNFGWLEKGHDQFLVKIMNPMSKETEYMRQNIWGNLLEKVVENLKYRDDVAVFEIGKAFSVENEEIMQRTSLAVAISNQTEEPIYELLEIFKELNNKLELQLNLEKYDLPEVVKDFFHPKRFIGIMKEGTQVGGISEIHPRLAHKFGTDKRVAVLEMYL